MKRQPFLVKFDLHRDEYYDLLYYKYINPYLAFQSPVYDPKILPFTPTWKLLSSDELVNDYLVDLVNVWMATSDTHYEEIGQYCSFDGWCPCELDDAIINYQIIRAISTDKLLRSLGYNPLVFSEPGRNEEVDYNYLIYTHIRVDKDDQELFESYLRKLRVRGVRKSSQFGSLWYYIKLPPGTDTLRSIMELNDLKPSDQFEDLLRNVLTEAGDSIKTERIRKAVKSYLKEPDDATSG